MRGTLALSSLFLVTTVAPAAGDVGVVVTGEATMQPELAAQLETWLRQHGHSLISAPLPPEAINTMIDCFVIEDEGCARKVVEKRAKSRSVVFARVDVQPSPSMTERTVTLTAYWFDKGRDAVTERRFCERCTPLTLRSTADDLMAALATAGQTEVGRLKLTTTPQGARVLIDNRALGLTPLDLSLPPGDHVIKLEHPDRAPEDRKVTIHRTETTTLDVTMTPAERPGRALPLAILGGGAALLVTGAVLIAIDEDVEDTGVQLPEYRDTAPAGVGIVVGGVAAVAVGGYFLWRSAKRTSAPVVSITPAAGLVGWAGSF